MKEDAKIGFKRSYSTSTLEEKQQSYFEDTIIVQGYAYIKPSKLRFWRKRFVILRMCHLLEYYVSSDMKIMVGQRTIRYCSKKGDLKIIFICGNGDHFRMKFVEKEDANLWWSGTRQVIPITNDSLYSEATHIPVSGCDFRVIRLIGKGAFGSVYKVKKIDTARDPKFYALKILKKGDSTVSALIERHISERARHPFVVQLQFSYQSSSNFYLISDFYGGGSLHYHLRKSKNGYFPENVVQFWGIEIVLALEHLHSLGILHRDLKLENILLDSIGHIGITDFGLSTDHSKDTISFKNSRTSICIRKIQDKPIGTPYYFAPEVLTESSTSYTVDMWAFGIILHELLVGSVPFKGGSRGQLFHNILNQPLNIPWNLMVSGKTAGFQRTLSRSATMIIEGLLEKNPKRRFGIPELKNSPFFEKFVFDPEFLKSSWCPPFRPACYNAEINVKHPLLSRGKKTLSSACCGGPKYIPGFSFVRTSSKSSISEEIDPLEMSSDPERKSIDETNMIEISNVNFESVSLSQSVHKLTLSHEREEMTWGNLHNLF